MANYVVTIKQKWQPKAHWRKRVKELAELAKKLGFTYTGVCLDRSARDKPRAYIKGDKSGIAKIIKNSPQFKREKQIIIKSIRKTAKKNKKKASCKKKKEIEFINQPDLFFSLQHVRYTWKAKKKNKQWKVKITITDKYDFNKITKRKMKRVPKYLKPLYKYVIIPITNFALKAHKCDAINWYDIKIALKDTI